MRPVLVLLHRYVGLATALFLFLPVSPAACWHSIMKSTNG